MWRIPKGVARVKYQRLNKKIRERKRERERAGKKRRNRKGHTSILIRDILHVLQGLPSDFYFSGSYHVSVKTNKQTNK